MANKVSIQPAARPYIVSHARREMPWKTILGEWIDNSFDAGATTVEIDFRKDLLVIADDGCGAENVLDMVQPGASSRHATTRLGRYGVGAKEAALVAGKENSLMRVQSIRNGIRYSVSVDWATLDSWEIDAPVTQTAQPGERGTKIQIQNYKKRQPEGPKAFSLLLDELGYLFSRAIKQGRQVKVRRNGGAWTPVVRWEHPLFDGESVVSERVVVNGKTAVVTVGMVRDGIENPRRGFTYFHEWRVIEEASANGCGAYAMSRICGFVELDSKWQLNANKDGIQGDKDALYAAVEQAARPVLERATAAARDSANAKFAAECSRMLGLALSTMRAKAKRAPGEKQGSVSPTGTGGKHRRAAVEQAGNTFISRRLSGDFPIEFGLCSTELSVGELAGSRVILNERNPLIDRIKRENNVLAATSVAMGLIGAAQVLEPGGQIFIKGIPPGTSSRDFAEIVGRMMANVAESQAEVGR